jgi:hypothetical protein
MGNFGNFNPTVPISGTAFPLIHYYKLQILTGAHAHARTHTHTHIYIYILIMHNNKLKPLYKGSLKVKLVHCIVVTYSMEQRRS